MHCGYGLGRCQRDIHLQKRSAGLSPSAGRLHKKLPAVPGWLKERKTLPEEGGFGCYELNYDENIRHPNPESFLSAPRRNTVRTTFPTITAQPGLYTVYIRVPSSIASVLDLPSRRCDSHRIVPAGTFAQRDGAVAMSIP